MGLYKYWLRPRYVKHVSLLRALQLGPPQGLDAHVPAADKYARCRLSTVYGTDRDRQVVIQDRGYSPLLVPVVGPASSRRSSATQLTLAMSAHSWPGQPAPMVMSGLVAYGDTYLQIKVLFFVTELFWTRTLSLDFSPVSLLLVSPMAHLILQPFASCPLSWWQPRTMLNFFSTTTGNQWPFWGQGPGNPLDSIPESLRIP